MIKYLTLFVLFLSSAYAIEPSKNSLYPVAKTFSSGQLKVSKTDSIYYEQRGNPTGPTVVYVHGGPGGASHPENSQWFDPAYYRIVLYDQRGTGKSIPSVMNSNVKASVFKNLTIEAMVDDLEKLRKHLHVSQWIIFGGSWGSTLSLAYSEKYPNHVAGLILYGIFLNQPAEMDEYYNLGTIKKRFPTLGEQAFNVLYHYANTKGYKTDATSAQSFVNNYYDLCVIQDDPIAQYLWSEFENFNDTPNQQSLNILYKRPNQNQLDPSDRSHAIFETIVFRYAYQGFNVLDPTLLAKLKKINIHIIQGLEDTEAPPVYAKKLVSELLKVKPDLNYKFVDGKHNGYSSNNMTAALLESINSFKVHSVGKA